MHHTAIETMDPDSGFRIIKVLGDRNYTILIGDAFQFCLSTWSHIFLIGSATLVSVEVKSEKTQIVELRTGSELESASGGSEHLAMVFHSDEGYSAQGLGWNEHGNFGLGHTNNLDQLTSIHHFPERLSVFAGNGTTWVQRE